MNALIPNIWYKNTTPKTTGRELIAALHSSTLTSDERVGRVPDARRQTRHDGRVNCEEIDDLTSPLARLRFGI